MTNYRVTDKDGRDITKGDTVTDFRGVQWTFDLVTRGVEYNGTAKVGVHLGACQQDFYAQVFDLDVVTLLEITVRRTEYVPTSDGDRVTRHEYESILTCDSAEDIANELERWGITTFSADPDFQPRGWWTDQPHDHPEGYTVERAAFRGDGVTDDVWREVWQRLAYLSCIRPGTATTEAGA